MALFDQFGHNFQGHFNDTGVFQKVESKCYQVSSFQTTDGIFQMLHFSLHRRSQYDLNFY